MDSPLRLKLACNGLTDPAARVARRFGLKLKALSAPARTVLAAMQIEADAAAREIEALKERLVEAEALADHDPMVPVLNRRAFLEALQRTTAFVGRYGGEAAVLFLDLDDLKPLNDQFGHAAGDAALKHLGRLLRENVRETDTVGRLGGDEFGVILVQVGKEEAHKKASSLVDVIEAHPCVYEGVEHVLHASIGLHSIVTAEPAEEALARADEAMYATKRATKRARAKV